MECQIDGMVYENGTTEHVIRIPKVGEMVVYAVSAKRPYAKGDESACSPVLNIAPAHTIFQSLVPIAIHSRGGQFDIALCRIDHPSDEIDFYLPLFKKQNFLIWGSEIPHEIHEEPMHPKRVTKWRGWQCGYNKWCKLWEHDAGVILLPLVGYGPR